MLRASFRPIAVLSILALLTVFAGTGEAHRFRRQYYAPAPVVSYYYAPAYSYYPAYTYYAPAYRYYPAYGYYAPRYSYYRAYGYYPAYYYGPRVRVFVRY